MLWRKLFLLCLTFALNLSLTSSSIIRGGRALANLTKKTQYKSSTLTRRSITRPVLGDPRRPLAFIHADGVTFNPSTESSITVMEDFTDAAAGFFGGVRIPASLVAGASFGELFSLSKETHDTSNKTMMEKVLIRLYNTCILCAFLFSMCAIVIATAANVSILHGGFNPIAETGYQFLTREFEFEFVSCRLSFLTSLMVFLVAVTCKIAYAFRLHEKEAQDVALAVIFSIVGVISLLFSYINSTLYCWPSLPCMAIHLAEMIMIKAKTMQHPLMSLALLSQGLSLFFGAKYLFKSLKAFSVDKET